MDPLSLLGGLVAYLLSALVAVGLVFVTYRINLRLTDHIDEERLLLAGHRSLAVALGSVVLCQAILLRHAVFPCMVMIRELFFRPFAASELVLVALRCLLLFAVVGLLGVASVAGAALLFSRLTRAIPEREEILKDNLAVAILFSFVLLGITLILNEGLADLSRALVPLEAAGLLRLP
jgi:uncharacterized membrane protein YjfL (UPF0719 family)